MPPAFGLLPVCALEVCAGTENPPLGDVVTVNGSEDASFVAGLGLEFDCPPPFIFPAIIVTGIVNFGAVFVLFAGLPLDALPEVPPEELLPLGCVEPDPEDPDVPPEEPPEGCEPLGLEEPELPDPPEELPFGCEPVGLEEPELPELPDPPDDWPPEEPEGAAPLAPLPEPDAPDEAGVVAPDATCEGCEGCDGVLGTEGIGGTVGCCCAPQPNKTHSICCHHWGVVFDACAGVCCAVGLFLFCVVCCVCDDCCSC